MEDWDLESFLHELGIKLEHSGGKVVKLQPFQLEQPIDTSLDQEYYMYYYVGLADGKSPEFRDTIFQYDYGFEWTIYVNDG